MGHTHAGSCDSIMPGSTSSMCKLSFSPHSQIVMDLQPASLRCFICRASRSAFRFNFSCQKALRVAGVVA